MAKLFANSGDPDQMPRSVASDLGLHCLPVTLLRVSRLQWVNHYCAVGNIFSKKNKILFKMFLLLAICSKHKVNECLDGVHSFGYTNWR